MEYSPPTTPMAVDTLMPETVVGADAVGAPRTARVRSANENASGVESGGGGGGAGGPSDRPPPPPPQPASTKTDTTSATSARPIELCIGYRPPQRSSAAASLPVISRSCH